MGRTFLQHKEQVARKVRMSLNDDDQKEMIERWINEAQDAIAREQGWWFVNYTFSITPLTTTNQYPFPTEDINGNARVLESIDAESMRTKSRKLDYEFAANIDQQFFDWARNQETGAPRWWTVEGYNISFNRIPSQDFIDNNEVFMFRGFAAFGDLSADSDESVIPDRWRYLLETYAEGMGHERQGDESMSDRKEREFRLQLEQMVAKCRPVYGVPKNVRAPTIFNLPARRTGRQTSVRR